MVLRERQRGGRTTGGLAVGIERNLLGFLGLCVGPWGKEAPLPDLPVLLESGLL